MAQKLKHITVAVTPEQYYQIRLLAAEFDTTVTNLVAYLLKRLPDALRRANYPKPQTATAQTATTPSPLPAPAPTPLPLENANLGCETVESFKLI